MMLGMKGFYRIRTINKFSGKSRIDTGWYANTLLDSGMEIMASRSDWMNYCQVGTDGTAATSLQTGLLAHHAGTSDIIDTTYSAVATPPYYGYKRKTWRFAAGTVAANLSEVGIGWGAGPGADCISRAQILDPVLQTPTTITPLIDEILEVMYELRYYAPTVDVIGPQVTLDGVVYDTITRAANVTDGFWGQYIGSALGVIADDLLWKAYDGNIGAVTTGPSGVAVNCDSSNQYNSAYVANSQEIQINCPVGIGGWNLGAGIRSIRYATTAGYYQTEFTAVPGGTTIPKTSSYTMLMSWVLNWNEL